MEPPAALHRGLDTIFHLISLVRQDETRRGQGGREEMKKIKRKQRRKTQGAPVPRAVTPGGARG